MIIFNLRKNYILYRFLSVKYRVVLFWQMCYIWLNGTTLIIWSKIWHQLLFPFDHNHQWDWLLEPGRSNVLKRDEKLGGGWGGVRGGGGWIRDENKEFSHLGLNLAMILPDPIFPLRTSFSIHQMCHLDTSSSKTNNNNNNKTNIIVKQW